MIPKRLELAWDKTLLTSYAGRMVRLELFLGMVAPDHCCVLDEQELIKEAEATIREHARAARPDPAQVEVLVGYVHCLYEMHLSEYGLDRDAARVVLERLKAKDLGELFGPRGSRKISQVVRVKKRII